MWTSMWTSSCLGEMGTLLCPDPPLQATALWCPGHVLDPGHSHTTVAGLSPPWRHQRPVPFPVSIPESGCLSPVAYPRPPQPNNGPEHTVASPWHPKQ